MGHNSLYRRIEERFGFTLPTEYVRMRELGWFDIGPGEGRNVYEHPSNHQYLWLNEMEWMPLEDICGGDSGFFAFSKGGLVPFAFTGAGDHWCWYPACTVNDATSVVFCPRDSTIGWFYAPHFLGAAYRQMLAYASEGMPLDAAPLARRHFRRWLDDLGPFFPADWQHTIAHLIVAPQQVIQTPQGVPLACFLSTAECDSIVRRDLAFDRRGEEFKWMVD